MAPPAGSRLVRVLPFSGFSDSGLRWGREMQARGWLNCSHLAGGGRPYVMVENMGSSYSWVTDQEAQFPHLENGALRKARTQMSLSG